LNGLLEYGDKRIPIKIGIRLYLLKNGNTVASEGLIRILEAIDKYGSIRAASQKLNINYKKTWLKLSTSERKLGIKLLNRKVGRAGCELTDDAKIIIKVYYELLAKLKDYISRD
jgi:molybdate transport system regulatory protein